MRYAFLIEGTLVFTLFQKRLTLPSEGRRIIPVILVFILQVAALLLPTGECHDDPLVLRTQVTTIGAVCGNRQAKNRKGGTQELEYLRSQSSPRFVKPWLFPNIPRDRRNSTPRLAIPRTWPPKISSFYGIKNWK